MARAIGIDLGTSNSAAAVVEGGRPAIIPSAEGMTVGGKAFPSYVAITKDGQKLVGEPARRQAAVNPEGTVLAELRRGYSMNGKVLRTSVVKISKRKEDGGDGTSNRD